MKSFLLTCTNFIHWRHMLGRTFSFGNSWSDKLSLWVDVHVLRIIFTIKTNDGFPIFLTSTVTEIFMEMSFCTPERFPVIPVKGKWRHECVPSIRFQIVHFVAKHTQKFNTLTRSDMCESMVGWRSIICEIEKRKLFFFGKLFATYNTLGITTYLYSLTRTKGLYCHLWC
jgi:hypothetical protein